MKETIPQTCPLCAADAEYYPVDYGNLKYFKCSNCTYFQISTRAESVLEQTRQQWRGSYSEKAKQTPEDHLLVITVPSGQAEAGLGSVTVSGEFRPKAELSL